MISLFKCFPFSKQSSEHYLSAGHLSVLHCVDRIYCDTLSARIDRLIPIWKQLSDGRLHTGKTTSVSQPPAYGCLAGY